jgi:energy-coupling factor transporter ATP-binding protein EcfA2
LNADLTGLAIQLNGGHSMSFKQLKFANWRQFSQVEIDFHPNLTIITGANGAGKSTILNILGQIIGAHRPYLSVPTKEGGAKRFVASIFSVPSRLFDWLRPKSDPSWSNIGMLSYENGTQSDLQVPTQGQQSYSLNIANQQHVNGFLMPSHRMMANYQQVPNLAFGGMDPQTAFGRLIGEAYSVFNGGHTGYSVLFRLKELLSNWANSGEGNSIIEEDAAQKQAYEGFLEVLKKVLPSDLGFKGLKILPPDIVIETESGDFLIDALSGGLTAIIEMAALIYTRSLCADVADGRFVVTMDEPENHLHPAIQRTILTNFVRTFPRVQFIVATHSPFIVTSSKDSRVYALLYENVEIVDERWDSNSPQAPEERAPQRAKRVKCLSLASGGLSGSPSEILRDILGVPVTMPLWVEDSLEIIVGNYRDRPFDERTIADFKRDIEAAGLSKLFPEALLHLGKTN